MKKGTLSDLIAKEQALKHRLQNQAWACRAKGQLDSRLTAFGGSGRAACLRV